MFLRPISVIGVKVTVEETIRTILQSTSKISEMCACETWPTTKGDEKPFDISGKNLLSRIYEP